MNADKRRFLFVFLPEGFDPLSIPSEPSDRLVDFLQSVTSTLLLDDTFSPQTAVQAFLGSSTPDSIGQYWIDGGWGASRAFIFGSLPPFHTGHCQNRKSPLLSC